MIETIGLVITLLGLVIAVLGLLFAFEAPRRKFLSLFRLNKRSNLDMPPSNSTIATLSEHDRTLIKNFRSLFADSGILRMYIGHDFLLPLRKEATVPLYTVVETWVDEAHLFSNPELRELQLAFISAANELSSKIVGNTVPDNNGNISVITSRMDPENLPQHVKDEAASINAKLPLFIQTHEALIAKCNVIS